MMGGLMLLAIVIGAGFLVRDVQQTSMEYVFSNHVYKESELQLAETAMSSAGLKNYEVVGMRIRVPKDKRDLYIKALAEGGATPQQLGSHTKKALSEGNMLESMYMSRTRVGEARQKDLANALESLPFVDKVYITYDEKREGFAAQSQSTASVHVLPRSNRPLEEQQKRSIMHQVKSAFAGLKYENISLMDLSSGLSMSGGTDPMNSEQQRYYQQKLQAEQRLKEKARNLLSDYGDVRVEANVEIDTTLREETESVKYADKPVTIQTSTTSKNSESSKPVAGGRPGTEPNAISNRPQSLATSTEQTNKNKEQQESERKIVGQETTLSEKIGLAVKSASLSVSIPLSYYNLAYRREWQESNPGKAITATEPQPLGQTELKTYKEYVHKKIQALLANLLPEPPKGVDGLPRIIVDDYLDYKVEPIPGPTLTATAGSWFASNWQSLVMFGLIGVVLLSIRSFVAAGGEGNLDEPFARGFDIPLDSALEMELGTLTTAEAEAVGGENAESGVGSVEDEAKRARARFSSTGGDMRSELASLIKENPDVAASLLRSWIGEAA